MYTDWKMVSKIICIYFLMWTVDGKVVTKYDIVDFEIVGNRPKRSAMMASRTPDADLELAFNSMDTDFHLLLLKDPSLDHIPIEVGHPKKKGEFANASAVFYEGHLMDRPSQSTVLCFLSNNSLTAVIDRGNETFYVEPAKTFLKNPRLDPRKIAVYRATAYNPHQGETLDSEYFQAYHYMAEANVTEYSGIDVANLTEEVFCKMEVVADHTLYQYFNQSVDDVAATLYLHAKFADQVLRSTDFGMTGRPSGVRVTVSRIFIYKTPEDENYPMTHRTIENMTAYLDAFSVRDQSSPFCLSFGLLYRPFLGSTRGLAFMPVVAKGRARGGGVCEKPLPLKDSEGFPPEFTKRHPNTGVVNLQNEELERIPLSQSLRTFAHEVAHGFGSDHDSALEDPRNCGNVDYLMGVRHHRGGDLPVLSPCSRKNISEVLLVKGGCLKPTKAECGNGVREGTEACDCGTRATCMQVDSCCTPYCTMLNWCSPKEQACCKDCNSIHPSNTVCYRDDFACTISFCDGSSPDCPEPVKSSDIFCRPMDRFCASNDSECEVVCEKNGLKDCVCKQSQRTECLRCCQRFDACIPAYELGLNASSGRHFFLESGYGCSQGQCDGKGVCERNQTSVLLRVCVALFLMVLSGLVAFGIFIFYREKRLRRPGSSVAEPLAEET